MIISCLIIFITIFCFDFIGYLTTKKLSINNQNLIFPIGFIVFMGIFELISLIPMLTNNTFSYFLIFFLSCLLISIILLLKRNFNGYKETIVDRFKNKYFLLNLILAIIGGIIVSLLAVGASDSWLFSPMTLSCIQNNRIFSHNGITIDGMIQSYHYTDSYYLFQAVLTKLSPLFHFTFMLTFIKFLEAFIIIMTFGYLIDALLKRNKKLFLIIIIICFIVGSSFFTNYPNSYEIKTHTYDSMSLGINLLNNVGIVLFISLICGKFNHKARFILIPLYTLACFSFSSSSLFIIFSILFVAANIFVFYQKDKINLLATCNGFFIIAIFASIYFTPHKTVFFILNILLIFLVFAFGYLFIIKQNIKLLSKALFCLDIVLILTNIFHILISGKLVNILNGIFSMDSSLLFPNYTNYYFDITNNLLFILLIIPASIYIYKNLKTFGIYLLLMIFFFANPISYSGVGDIINTVVYHRVYQLFLPGVINLLGISAIINYFDNKYHFDKSKYLYGIFLPLIMFFPYFDYPKTYFFNQNIYKLQSKDVYQLSVWDYPKTKNIVLDLQPYPGPSGYATIADLFKVRSDLSWVDCSSVEPFYLILNNKIELPKEVEFASDNYNVYYYEGGNGCQLSRR